MTLKGLKFTATVSFILHGTANFYNCKFYGDINIHSTKHQHEPEVAHILKTDSYARKHQILLLSCIFKKSVIIEFESNVRMLLIEKSSFKTSTLIKNIRYYEQIGGIDLPLPGYILVQVKDSEITNSKASKEKDRFLGINVMENKDGENEEIIRKRVKHDKIALLSIINGSFYLNFVVNIVKVKNVEINGSKFERSSLLTNEVQNMNINQCKFEGSEFHLNTNEKHFHKVEVWTRNLVMSQNIVKGFIVFLRKIEAIEIQDCSIENTLEESILIEAPVHKKCPNSTLRVTNSKINGTILKIQNFMQVNLINLTFNLSQVIMRNISLETVGIQNFQNKTNDKQSTITKSTFLKTAIIITKSFAMNMIYCTFTDTYFKLGDLTDQSQATNIDIKTASKLDVKLKIKYSTFQDTLKSTNLDSTLDCIAQKEDSFMTIKQVKLKILGSNFTMTCVVPRGFVEWKSILDSKIQDVSQVSVCDSIFDASGIKSTVPLLTFPYGSRKFKMSQVKFLCSFNIGFDWLDVRSILQCKSYCEQGQYPNINNTEPAISVVNRDVTDLSLFESAACPNCPVGASCRKNGIIPLPDYWGYRETNGEIKMIRCPKDYCCTGSSDCKSIKSCKRGRTGTLCGQCEDNRTESLFSSNCVPVTNCQPWLVSTFYILAAILYALFLITYNDIKNILLKKIKKLSKYFTKKEQQVQRQKRRSLNRLPSDTQMIAHLQEKSQLVDSLLLHSYCISSKATGITSDISETVNVRHPVHESKRMLSQTVKTKSVISISSESKENGNKEQLDNHKDSDNSMKYLQILFYYVQDATLFKVYLPIIGSSSDSWLIDFLQFSPEVLSLYTGISEMCFLTNTTAALKVVFISIFGPCVMMILLLILTCHFVTCKYIFKSIQRWNSFKHRLCQAFILVVLLSYQNIVKGTFTLLKCVDIRNQKVLHIDANIFCFTWWQTATEIFLAISVIPVFLVLALGPYYVKKKQLSIKMFVISCILPLPVGCYCVIANLIRKRVNKSDDTDVETSTESEVKYSKSEKIIIDHLLKHYKNIKVFGVSMTWLGIHKFYRMALVWCHTYIMDPLPRLSAMSVLVIVVAFTTIFVKPYKETTANTIAILSYAASISISVINIVKSSFIVGVYNPNDLVKSMVKYFDLCEVILLTWVPVFTVALWLVHTVWKFVKTKRKKKEKIS